MKKVLAIIVSDSTASSIVRIKQYNDIMEKNGYKLSLLSFRTQANIKRLLESEKARISFLQFIIFKLKYLPYIIIHSLERILICIKIIIAPFRYNIIINQKCELPFLLNFYLCIFNKLIYDIDDAVFLFDENRVKNQIKYSSIVMAGNLYLYDFCSRFNNNVKLIPSVVDLSKFNRCPDRKNINLGWLGSSSTFIFLEKILPSLFNFLDTESNAKLYIVGVDLSRTSWVNHDRVINIPHYKHDDIPNICSKFSIGLMPLENDEFSLGKCAMKSLIYSAAHIATVASPIGEVTNIFKDNESIVYVNEGDCWVESIQKLIDDGFRQELADLSYETVRKGYCVDSVFHKSILRIFKHLAEDK